FFQAEDGIRDKLVTGVQTCALPIFGRQRQVVRHQAIEERAGEDRAGVRPETLVEEPLEPERAEEEQRREHREGVVVELGGGEGRSEERRVGKEGRWRR